MLENQKLKKKLEHVEHERLELSRSVQMLQGQAPTMGSKAYDNLHDEYEMKRSRDR